MFVVINGTTQNPSPVPSSGQDIPISTTVSPRANPLSAISLIYRINYGPEVTLALPCEPLTCSDTFVVAAKMCCETGLCTSATAKQRPKQS